MIVACHQPVFLPYLGVIRKIMDSDCFILLEDVQYVRRGYINRNKILIQGKPQWLTVPVKKASRETPINEIEISYDTDWRDKMLSTIEHVYKKAPYFSEVFPIIEDALKWKFAYLMYFNAYLLISILNYLEINTKVCRSSQFDVYTLNPTDRLITLTKKVGGDTYLSGENGRKYMELDKFKDIKVEFQEYKIKPYPQFNSKEFVPYLSILDYMMNMGKDISLI